MGSDCYRVKVLKKTARAVSLDVRVTYPRLDIPADKSFALMMLRENASGASALADAVGENEMLSEAWQRQYANGFIESVDVRDLENVPPAAAEDDSNHPYWLEPARWLRGKLDVVVTDPAWIAHLEPGAAWDSRAFRAAEEYDPRAPMRPGDTGGEAPNAGDDGLMWVPTRLWASSGFPSGGPAVVQVPAYEPRAYRAKDPKKGTFAAKDLRDLQYRCVHATERGEQGVLVLRGKNIELLRFSDGSGGMSGWGHELPGPVGLLELKPGARRGVRVPYERVLRNLEPCLVSAKVSGRRVELGLEVPPGAPGKLVSSATDVLALIVAPLVGSSDLTKASPLTKALRAEMKRRDVGYFPDLLPEVASGIVERFEVDAPRANTLDLDAAPQSEVKAFFSAPWPVCKVTAEVFQPAFLEHLAKPLRPTVLDYVRPPMKKPAKWSGPPLA